MRITVRKVVVAVATVFITGMTIAALVSNVSGAPMAAQPLDVQHAKFCADHVSFSCVTDSNVLRARAYFCGTVDRSNDEWCKQEKANYVKYELMVKGYYKEKE
jgi:hypothetical protein